MEDLQALLPSQRADTLEMMPRPALQKLAKQAGLKANAKSHVLINSLLELLASKDQDLKPKDSGCAQLPDGTPVSAALHAAPAKKGDAAQEGDKLEQPPLLSTEVPPSTSQRKRRDRDDDSEITVSKRVKIAASYQEPEADKDGAQAQRAPTQPINPAASPVKPPGDPAASAAPACRTILLPALDNSAEAPAADSSGAGQPCLLEGAEPDQDEGIGTQEIDIGHGLLEAPQVAMDLEKAEIAAACEAGQPDAGQSQGQLEQESQGFFSAHLQHNSTRTGSLPLGALSSEGKEGRSAAVPQLASMHSNPLAEKEPGPADAFAAAARTADVEDCGATESFSQLADLPATNVPGAEADVQMLEELSKVEAMVFGDAPTQLISQGTPSTAVNAIMEIAEHDAAEPKWVCDNPVFDEAASMEVDGSGYTAMVPSENNPGLSGQPGNRAMTQNTLARSPPSGKGEGSAADLKAFERGRKSGMWIGATQVQLNQLETAWDSYKSTSTARGWTLPSLEEVQAESRELAASGCTTVTTPKLHSSSLTAIQQRKARLKRTRVDGSKRSGSSKSLRADSSGPNSARARSPLRASRFGVENNASGTPSRLSKPSSKAVLTPMGGLQEQDLGAQAEGTPGTKARTKAASAQLADRAQKAEALFAARRAAALAKGRK